MFADDTKLYHKADIQCSRDALQADIQEAYSWSAKWQMPFNEKKCAVLHIGNTNPGHQYQMGCCALKVSFVERDLGILIDSELKFRQQAASAVSKASRVLAIIRKSFVNFDPFILPLLYKTLVRPILEYGNAIWGPFNRADQQLVERVQRRATRLVVSLRGLSYKDRLRSLNLPSLYYRRLRGDMIRVYNLINGGIDQDHTQFFILDRDSRTRGHAFKLKKPDATTRPRRTSFGVRIVDEWNALPRNVVEASTLNAFKSSLDDHWRHRWYTVPEMD